MKKLTLLLVLMISTCMFSQFRFGVRGGLQRTNMADIHGDSKGRISFQVGALAQYSIDSNDQFYIQGEVNYLNHGEKDGDDKFYVTYITVPIMLRAYFSEAESEFFGEFGPQFAFEIGKSSNNLSTEGVGYPKDEVTTESFDFSLGLGLGYSYKRRWEIGGRYNYGFVDIYPDYESRNGKKNRTSTLQGYISYVFD